MEIGKRVKVSNPNQINYSLEGDVIESDNTWGEPMSKVKFEVAEVWYSDKDLEIVSNKQKEN